MTSIIGRWPNTRRILQQYLTSRMQGREPAVPVYTQRPPEGWAASAPCIFLLRLPGPPSRPGYDKTYTFDVQVVHTSLPAVDELARDVEILLETMPTEADSGPFIDDLTFTAEFGDLPLGDVQDVFRLAATVDITVRPQ